MPLHFRTVDLSGLLHSRDCEEVTREKVYTEQLAQADIQ